MADTPTQPTPAATGPLWRRAWRVLTVREGQRQLERLVLLTYSASLVMMAIGVHHDMELVRTGFRLGLAGLALMPFTRWRPRWSPVFVALGLWAGATILSDLVNGLWWSEASDKIERLWRLGVFVVVMAAPAPLVRRRGALLGALLLGAAVSAGVAWYQHRTGLDPVNPYVSMSEWKWGDAWRARGLLDHPLTLAGVMTLLGAFGTTLLMHLHTGWWRRILLATALAAPALCLVLSGSRGYVLVAAVVGGLLVLTLRYRWQVAGIAALVLVGAAVATWHPMPMERLTQALPEVEMPLDPVAAGDADIIARLPEVDRVARLHFGMELFADYPIFGTGRDYYRYWNAFATRAEPWARANGQTFGGYHTHNSYLQVAVEAGAVGLLAWLAIWAVAGRELIRRAVALRSANENPAWPLAGLAALLVILGGSMFEHTFQDTELQCLLWMLLAMALWPNTRSIDGTAGERTRAPWPVTRWTLIYHVLGCGLVVAALTTLFRFPSEITTPFGIITRTPMVVALFAVAALGFAALAAELRHVRRKVAPPATDA